MQNPGVPAVSLGDWPAAGLGPDLDHIPLQPDTLTPHDLISTTPLFGPLSGRRELSGSETSPWFLQDETWVKEHQQPHGSAGVELDPFIHAVEGMLQSWARTGHNSFIHERLYGKSMPPCLQDAFTTLSAYTSCTPVVKETILQIAEDRSSALACESLPSAAVGGGDGGDGDGGAAAVRGYLARVHALFTYIFIRLFDGSVRARAAAEELWQLWILTESVRRSLIIIETIANVYECMVRGWAECTGAVMFTARAGLWEAKSAVKWLELSSVESPLLASSLCPEQFISRYAAGEIDGFAKVVWGCAVGVDRMQCWIDGTVGESRI
ncbi:hypothetical protein CHGG_04485 [Chaetomium globosum CBS 148.51]|uniref:Transcription factor domain-containing protein n=1 Tax=Chaetomium globosum (strain ATCC 6205 / CBS 148.51 / DSM 1962 / NBRC 6347 / NRRL 1970) TaxID=306901 RepID=Q2H161_CHAGB|nr:uncharacterized protein CHGG_04485 [Chaetomium globosum CBS 148.51]EAQ87866.1 hypothetical protein CHGG_04485 [Chaetomium globosum CBS 148.51]